MQPCELDCHIHDPRTRAPDNPFCTQPPLRTRGTSPCRTAG